MSKSNADKLKEYEARESNALNLGHYMEAQSWGIMVDIIKKEIEAFEKLEEPAKEDE